MEKKQLNFEQAKEKALRLLEFRSHSERELTNKLLYAGADRDDIEEILEFCRRYGFVNDRSYAERKAKDLKNLKRFGKRRIVQELRAKGISAEDIEAAVEELDFEDAEDTLYPLVEKKLAGDFERKSIDRCMRYFIYRGYEISDIKNCIEKVKGDTYEL
jgi:regulatory protein